MKKTKMKSHLDKLVFIFLILTIFHINGCQNISNKSFNSSEQSVPEYSYNILQFLNENEILLLRYDQRNAKTKSILIYDISSHRLYKPLNMNGADYPRVPIFSRDKKQVAFASDKDGGLNIYVMNADGSNVRQLTHSQRDMHYSRTQYVEAESNAGPSFSPDGKRILFKRARWMKNATPIWWDVFEIEIETGQERRLTYIDSHLMSDPFYLLDGKRFVFQGSKKINDEGIYIANKESDALNKISAGGWWIPGPRISWNDKIVFMGGTHLQHPDHDLFIYENGKINRLNWIQRGVHLPNLAISPDGSRILLEMGKYKEQYKEHYIIEYSLWIGKADGTGLQEIYIPWDSLKDRNLDFKK
jgi:Tol biopolymer transport system component